MPGKDILVVEDDLDLAETLAIVLTGEGHEVRIAENGRVGLREVEQRMPSLIILDLFMPLMDGRGFARELAQRYPERPPIVLMTAATNAGERAADIGADEILAKPFEVRELLAVARRLLGASVAPAITTARPSR